MKLTGHGLVEDSCQRPSERHGELVDKGARCVGKLHCQRITNSPSYEKSDRQSQCCASAQRGCREI